jgi:hypothetical protein
VVQLVFWAVSVSAAQQGLRSAQVFPLPVPPLPPPAPPEPALTQENISAMQLD